MAFHLSVLQPWLGDLLGLSVPAARPTAKLHWHHSAQNCWGWADSRAQTGTSAAMGAEGKRPRTAELAGTSELEQLNARLHSGAVTAMGQKGRQTQGLPRAAPHPGSC